MLTPAEITAAAARIVERTCREQNLPRSIEDPAVVARVAALLRGSGPIRRATTDSRITNTTASITTPRTSA